jgi:predicted nucleotidyltransferase
MHLALELVPRDEGSFRLTNNSKLLDNFITTCFEAEDGFFPEGNGMDVHELLRKKRDDILQIASKHGVAHIRIFGSAARGESREDSDIDFLIEVNGPTTPWFPGSLAADLEKLLGRRVDVVEPEAIREPLRRRILEEAVPL